MSNPTHNPKSDEISIYDIVSKFKQGYRYLLTKSKTIILCGIIGMAMGFGYTYFRAPTYTATCTFVLEEGDSGNGLSQYAGLASMVGIDLNGGGGGIFKGDNILQLYKSRKMIQETLLSNYNFKGKPQSLINRFITFNNLHEKWDAKPETRNLSFDIPVSKFTIKHDSVLGKLVETINEKNLEVIKPDKKLSIIKVIFSSKDQLFAKAFTENIVKKVNQFYVDTKTKKSAENISILQNQADSVKAILNNSIGGVAAAIDANPNVNPAFLKLRVPSQRKQVDVQASSAIYQEMVKNLEISKITFRREKPLIQIIDEPILPLYSDKTGMLLSLFIGGALGVIAVICYFLIRKVLTYN